MESRNNLNVLKVDGVATGIETLIPIEERAITNMVAAGSEALATMDKVDTMATPIEAKITLMTNRADALIPVEELGMEAVEENMYAEAEAQGFFSETIGMSRVETEDGLAFYASIHQNKEGHISYELRLQLPNGDVSPKIIICHEYLVLAVSSNFNPKTISEPKLRNGMNTFIADIVLKCLGMGICCRTRGVYNILETMLHYKNNLPFYSELNEKLARMNFYKDVVAAIHGREPFKPIMASYLGRAKSYYPLASDEMDYIALQFNLTATELAKKLYRFGFLYRKPTSTGYQVKIRIFTDEEAKEMGVSPCDNCYCIRKLDNASLQSLQQRLDAKTA